MLFIHLYVPPEYPCLIIGLIRVVLCYRPAELGECLNRYQSWLFLVSVLIESDNPAPAEIQPEVVLDIIVPSSHVR